jgi:cytochrome c-type biogenesis protein CcmH
VSARVRRAMERSLTNRALARRAGAFAAGAVHQRFHRSLRGRRATHPIVGTLLVILMLSLFFDAAQSIASLPRSSLPTIERQVMCVTCKIPLNVAESPQADRERGFIRRLIANDWSEAQIKRALVGQYGTSVLALPDAKGFDIAAYLVPLAVVLGLLVLLGFLLPSWRRHARALAGLTPELPELDASDTARLEADLKRFE